MSEGSSLESPRPDRLRVELNRNHPLQAAPILPMIARVWHGWTRPEKADQYERLLRDEILPDIAAKTPEGYEGGEVFRRQAEDEAEFMTLLWFASMEGVRAFAGDDVRQAHVPEKAQRLLHRYEETARHYEHRDRVS